MQTPHEVRWTDYEGKTYYIGVGYTIDFQSYKKPPFVNLDENFVEKKLSEFGQNSNESLSDLLQKIKLNYEVIPTDCNCCS